MQASTLDDSQLSIICTGGHPGAVEGRAVAKGRSSCYFMHRLLLLVTLILYWHSLGTYTTLYRNPLVGLPFLQACTGASWMLAWVQVEKPIDPALWRPSAEAGRSHNLNNHLGQPWPSQVRYHPHKRTQVQNLNTSSPFIFVLLKFAMGQSALMPSRVP